jgi:hypothetical protein
LPTATYTPLATVTLGTTAASVTFSSIPATYRDLILVYNGTVAGGVFARIQFNGDTGSNYSNVRMGGNGSTTSSDTITGDNIAFGELQPTHNVVITQIMDYSATDKHKTVLSRSNAPSVNLYAIASRWASTSAITSLATFLSSGSYPSGSTFSLYGVIA